MEDDGKAETRPWTRRLLAQLISTRDRYTASAGNDERAWQANGAGSASLVCALLASSAITSALYEFSYGDTTALPLILCLSGFVVGGLSWRFARYGGRKGLAIRRSFFLFCLAIGVLLSLLGYEAALPFGILLLSFMLLSIGVLGCVLPRWSRPMPTGVARLCHVLALLLLGAFDWGARFFCKILARLYRLVPEPRCQFVCRRCNRQFRTPKVSCLHCKGEAASTSIFSTWPVTDTPLAASCPNCGRLHDTTMSLRQAQAQAHLVVRPAGCGYGDCGASDAGKARMKVWAIGASRGALDRLYAELGRELESTAQPPGVLEDRVYSLPGNAGELAVSRIEVTGEWVEGIDLGISGFLLAVPDKENESRVWCDVPGSVHFLFDRVTLPKAEGEDLPYRRIVEIRGWLHMLFAEPVAGDDPRSHTPTLAAWAKDGSVPGTYKSYNVRQIRNVDDLSRLLSDSGAQLAS